MELANNNIVDDYNSFSDEVKIDFSDKVLEMKYFIRDKEELEYFFSRSDFYKEKINFLRKKYLFKKIICRFYFAKFIISFEEMKSLIDFQSSICDEITIQKIGRDFNNFERTYEYVRGTYDKPISIILDIKDPLMDFKQSLKYIDEWDLSTVRFLYGKIDSHFSKYFLVSQLKKELPFYLTACKKRCVIKSLEDKKCSNIPISILAKSELLDFDGCCMDYCPRSKTHKNQRFIPPENMSFFNPKTLLWEERKNDGTFKKQRLLDFDNFNKVKISKNVLENNSTIKRVIDYLEDLNP